MLLNNSGFLKKAAALGHPVMFTIVGTLFTGHAVTLYACKGLAVLREQLQWGLSAQI